MVERDAQHQATVDGTLAKVRAAHSEAQRASARLARIVKAARAAGATWAEVGRALGMSGQGAQKRYGNSAERVRAHEVGTQLGKARRAAKKATARACECPICGQKFPSIDATRAHALTGDCWDGDPLTSAQQDGLREIDAPHPGDLWPDGTVQGRIRD